MKVIQRSALVCEILAWILLPMLFLSAYLSRIEGDSLTTPAHLRVYIILPALWMAVRLCAPTDKGPFQTFARAGAGFLGSSLLLFVSIYYGLILLGLDTWGRVATLPILLAYLSQLKGLTQSLEMDPTTSVLLLSLVTCAVAAIGFLAQSGFTQIVSARMAKSSLVRIVAILGLVSFAAVQTLEFFGAPRNDIEEPFALSVFPGRTTSYDGSPMASESLVQQRLDRAERQDYLPQPAQDMPNVILIVGDALRADAISTLGNPRAVTPFIDSMRSSGVTWWASPAYSACAESYCGLMGISKSRYQHAITTEALSLHDVLKLHGYKVKLLFGGDHTNFYGLARAFGDVHLFRDGSAAAEYMNDDSLVIRYTEELPDHGGEPVFLHYHLMSTHGLGLRLEQFKLHQPAVNYYSALAMARASGEERNAHIRNFYDNGVAQFDFVVSQLLGTLERKGYLDNAVVVITGDHGELLGEHGLYSHANSVFEPVLKVPLLISSYPSIEGPFDQTQRNTLVSAVDIAPTLTDLIGIPTPKGWSGISLRPLTNAPSTEARSINFWQADKVGAITQVEGRRFKYWYEVGSRREWYFDLIADPGEITNLMRSPDRDGAELEHLRGHVAQLIPAARTERFDAVEVSTPESQGRY